MNLGALYSHVSETALKILTSLWSQRSSSRSDDHGYYCKLDKFGTAEDILTKTYRNTYMGDELISFSGSTHAVRHQA